MAAEFPGTYWTDYELIDSGEGEKLERFGSQILSRPEPKALWGKGLSQREWNSLASVRFRPGAGFGRAGKEDSGTWERRGGTVDRWYIRYPGSQKGLDFSLRLGLTAFKHVGVFPEQAPNWEYIYSRTSSLVAAAKETAASSGKPFETPKVLNLFAYTGAASLAARAAGADVTHLDSVRQVVSWGSDNAARSGMQGIHWVVEDAMKFVAREIRRGHQYQGIMLDPPAYGHGPDGEKWKLDECLFSLMKDVSKLLSPSKGSFLILNLYSNGYSPLLGETVLREAFGPGEYTLSSGELALRDRLGKVLPLSIFVRAEF